MLARLSIRDIVLIDRLDIDFGSGLAALTGETGAGKSILLDAFALALGARGEAALVRDGAEQGQVTAAFELAEDHPARRVLAENDLGGEEELIVRRVQFADGRTRAFVNDQPVSVQVLRALGAALVEIHGQHDERAFVDAATHRALLDAYGGIEDDAAEVARLWDERRACEAAVAAHRAEVERASREAEWLRHCRRRADAPRAAGRARKRRWPSGAPSMMQAEKVAEDLRATHESISGAQSPVPPLATALAAPRAPRRASAGADRAGGEGDRRRAHGAGRGAARISKARCGRPNTIRRNSSASKSGCSRCAPPGASTMCRSTSSTRSPRATRAISP